MAARAMPVVIDQACAEISGYDRGAWCRGMTGRAQPGSPLPASGRAGDGSVFASKKPSAIDFANPLDWIKCHRRSPVIAAGARTGLSDTGAGAYGQ